MISLTIDKVDGFVARLRRKGIEVRWDGWTMVFFRESEAAKTSPRGRRHGERWGFEARVAPNSQGKWLVNKTLVRGNKVGA